MSKVIKLLVFARNDCSASHSCDSRVQSLRGRVLVERKCLKRYRWLLVLMEVLERLEVHSVIRAAEPVLTKENHAFLLLVTSGGLR